MGSLLGDLTLGARADFLKPEEPFSLRDVQPWLFNRRLSYIRKPLLRRKQGGANEIVYGMRHVGHAERNFAIHDNAAEVMRLAGG